jgi:hypothetical protein
VPVGAAPPEPMCPRGHWKKSSKENSITWQYRTVLSLKYLLANVQHIETPTRIKSWQQVLDAADADVATFVGTKLTTNMARKNMFNRYNMSSSATDDKSTWMERATNRVLAPRGVPILVKRKFNIGDIKLATSMNTGDLLHLRYSWIKMVAAKTQWP